MIRELIIKLLIKFQTYPKIRGGCKQCGACCRSLFLTWRGKPVTSQNEFKKLLNYDRHVYSRFIPDKQHDTGSALTFTCIHLNKNNQCSQHDKRPPICQKYPHKSIFKMGAELQDSCGYRIITKGCFEDIMDKKLK